MKERPILFSAPMVRAILEGRKTQTRRVVKLPHSNPLGKWEPFLFGGEGCRDSKGRGISGQMTMSHTRTGEVIGCPYGDPGDRLWVRETWAETDTPGGASVVAYRAGGCVAIGRDNARGPDYLIRDWAWDETPTPERWRPSIHMPRWASRITLEVTGVRVERLRGISYEDALAEGAIDGARFVESMEPGRRNAIGESADETARRLQWPQRNFKELWESINGAGSWDANPFVWVNEFKRVRP